jgi:hypothetical protein
MVPLFVAALIFVSIFISGCDEGECLVYGENCSGSYIEANYPGQDIGCCPGTVCERMFAHSTVLTCNSPLDLE